MSQLHAQEDDSLFFALFLRTSCAGCVWRAVHTLISQETSMCLCLLTSTQQHSTWQGISFGQHFSAIYDVPQIWCHYHPSFSRDTRTGSQSGIVSLLWNEPTFLSASNCYTHRMRSLLVIAALSAHLPEKTEDLYLLARLLPLTLCRLRRLVRVGSAAWASVTKSN